MVQRCIANGIEIEKEICDDNQESENDVSWQDVDAPFLDIQ